MITFLIDLALKKINLLYIIYNLLYYYKINY